MNDLIYRQTATQITLEFIVEYLGGAFDEDLQKKLMERMNAVPHAQPERVKGKWIILKHSHNAMCSKCYQTFVDAYDLENWDNYCRHCGAIMEDMITEEEWDGI